MSKNKELKFSGEISVNEVKRITLFKSLEAPACASFGFCLFGDILKGATVDICQLTYALDLFHYCIVVNSNGMYVYIFIYIN